MNFFKIKNRIQRVYNWTSSTINISNVFTLYNRKANSLIFWKFILSKRKLGKLAPWNFHFLLPTPTLIVCLLANNGRRYMQCIFFLTFSYWLVNKTDMNKHLNIGLGIQNNRWIFAKKKKWWLLKRETIIKHFIIFYLIFRMLRKELILEIIESTSSIIFSIGKEVNWHEPRILTALSNYLVNSSATLFFFIKTFSPSTDIIFQLSFTILFEE